MNKQSAALFLSGTIGRLDLLPVLPSADDLIVCADGGIRHALELGLIPALVVGDFDSVTDAQLQTCRELGAELCRFPADKDETDMELALKQLNEAGCKDVSLYGALGGRLDHELGNLTAAARFAALGMQLKLVAEHLIGFFAHGPAEFKLEGNPGDTLSLVPLSAEARGVSISGARWPLQNAALSFGRSLTISNRFSAERVEIRIETGDVLILTGKW